MCEHSVWGINRMVTHWNINLSLPIQTTSLLSQESPRPNTSQLRFLSLLRHSPFLSTGSRSAIGTKFLEQVAVQFFHGPFQSATHEQHMSKLPNGTIHFQSIATYVQ